VHMDGDKLWMGGASPVHACGQVITLALAIETVLTPKM